MAPIDTESAAVLRVFGRLVDDRRAVLGAHTSMLEEAIAADRAPASAGAQLDLIASELETLRDMYRELAAVFELGQIEARHRARREAVGGDARTTITSPACVPAVGRPCSKTTTRAEAALDTRVRVAWGGAGAFRVWLSGCGTVCRSAHSGGPGR